jgi:hypothetical protein
MEKRFERMIRTRALFCARDGTLIIRVVAVRMDKDDVLRCIYEEE